MSFWEETLIYDEVLTEAQRWTFIKPVQRIPKQISKNRTSSWQLQKTLPRKTPMIFRKIPNGRHCFFKDPVTVVAVPQYRGVFLSSWIWTFLEKVKKWFLNVCICSNLLSSLCVVLQVSPASELYVTNLSTEWCAACCCCSFVGSCSLLSPLSSHPSESKQMYTLHEPSSAEGFFQ